MSVFVTYIWLDGNTTQKLRSKTKVLNLQPSQLNPSDIPEWGFDGSSTKQATTDDSDCILNPVRVVKDPVRKDYNLLALCEVCCSDGKPHPTNSRARLRKQLDTGATKMAPWIGFEQEYVFKQGDTVGVQTGHVLGWPSGGFPPEQGPYYCGVGADETAGREIVEAHMQACNDAGLHIYGTNAEVMLGQWEFQVGPRGDGYDHDVDPLTISDDLWLARWLLYRIAEEYDVSVTLHPKPVSGDWNGSGLHTNFSTAAMRDHETGATAIAEAVAALKETHKEHMEYYGEGNNNRLVGKFETSNFNTFSAGDADRGASVRVPMSVAKQGHGYIEDRRPGANADPYQVSRCLVKTICKPNGNNN